MANSKKKKSTNGRYTPKKPLVVSSAADFKEDSETVLLPLPSGKVVEAQKPKGLTAFLTGGHIPNSLLPMLNDAIDGKAPSAESLVDMLKDSDKLTDLMTMVDSLTVAVVVNPPVAHPPEDRSQRRSDIVYTDDISDDDKMFIMSFAMAGAKDTERFRSEQAAIMDSMADVQGVQDATEPATQD